MVRRFGLRSIIAGTMVVALFASACSPSATPSGGSNAATATPAAGASDAAIGPKVEVVFWQRQFEDYQQAWFKKQVAAFNAAHPAIEVKYTAVPGDAWDAKLKAAQAAGKVPDVLTTNYGAIKPGVVNGQFAKLDGLMKPEAFADIADNVKDFVRTKDGYFGYPMLVEPSTVLYYRKDLFTAAGLDPAKPPKNWDELIADARALTKGGVYGMNIAQTAPDLGWSSWGLQYNAAGHLPIADDWSAPRATDPAYTKLLQLYQTLYTEKLMPQEATFPYADASFYGQGKVAMSAGGSWEIGQLSADFKDTLANTAIAAFPSVDGDATKPTSTLGGWTLTIDAKSKVQQQAADFVSWLLAGDPAIMTDFFKAAGYSKYSPRASVAAALAADPDASRNPYLAIVSRDVLPYAKAEPAYPWDVSIAFGTAIEKAMKSGDIDAALAEADKAIADVITKQKLAGTAP